MISTRAALLILLGGLSACGPSAPPVPPPAPRPTGTIDGLYRGTSTRFKAEDKSCPHPGLVRFEVMDRSFRYRLNGPITVDATVFPDGSVSGEAGGFTLRGDWDGQKLEGDVVSIICALHFRAVKTN
jgi:hypothetical protein